MSKPLIFVLQLTGAGFLIAGAIATPIGWGQITIGFVLLIVAGFAIRERFRSG